MHSEEVVPLGATPFQPVGPAARRRLGLPETRRKGSVRIGAAAKASGAPAEASQPGAAMSARGATRECSSSAPAT